MFLKQRRLSISQRLTLTYSAILFGILLVFTVLFFFFMRQYALTINKGDVAANADIISKYMTSIQNLDPSAFKNLALSQNIFFSVFDRDKKLLYSNRLDLSFMQVFSEDTGILNDNGGILHGRGIFKQKNRIINTQREMHVNGTAYYIQVAKRFDDITDRADALPGVLLIASIFGTLVCFISGIFLTRKLLKPIQDISRTAKEITSKNLDMRIAIDGPEDELKDLAGTFNSMIVRLEGDFEKQRRFIADASHELRTPLSVIHGHVNMLKRWGKNDPEVLSRSLDTLKKETECMSKLLENLLYLAKDDNNTLALERDKFPLDILLKEVVDEALLVHDEYSILIKCEAGHMITADYNAMKQVLRNLTDNSIKYSTPPGEIVITAEQKKEGTWISVSDSGTGIPSECLPYIFDRFYRVDESRTKATGGSGLGLSIAKHIVQSHNGTITAESRPGKGTKIVIFIPVTVNSSGS